MSWTYTSKPIVSACTKCGAPIFGIKAVVVGKGTKKEIQCATYSCTCHVRIGEEHKTGICSECRTVGLYNRRDGSYQCPVCRTIYDANGKAHDEKEWSQP